MGNLWSRFKHKDVRIILLGLDSAGKTSILYRLKLGDLITTIPTIGFNVENIQYKDIHLTAWDIGSRDKIRPLFRHYYKGADAVVFVIDSHDPERLDELNYDVIKPAINAEELTNAVFLFLANKMDLEGTMTTDEIAEKLGLRFLKHPWGIIPVSAVSGDGLQNAMDWLAVRLGSNIVKARNFAQPQPTQITPTSPPTAKNTPKSKRSSSSSSSGTARTDSPKVRAKEPAAPLILVNSKMVDNAKPSPSSSPSLAVRQTASSSCQVSPALNYQRRGSSTVNSFSSYSISQALKEDRARRKLSTISISGPDGRRMSAASLCEPRRMSAISLHEQRRLSLTPTPDPRGLTFFPPTETKATGLTPTFTPPVETRATGLTPTPDLKAMSNISLKDSPPQEQPQPKLNLLSTDMAGGSPSLGAKSSESSSLSGFGSFSPIMADYIHSSRKNLESCAKEEEEEDEERPSDPAQIVSPSEHIQPHLRALGIKKTTFLSSSGKYIVNATSLSTNSPPLGAASSRQTSLFNTRQAQRDDVRPEYYTRNNLTAVGPPKPTLHHYMNPLDQSNASSPFLMAQDSPPMPGTSHRQSKIYSKPSKQTSQDSQTSSSSSSSQSKSTGLDLFCSPSRKTTSQSDINMAVVPMSGSKGAYCSRAYSAMKCLFFRPTKKEMQEETNSASSDDEGEETGACGGAVGGYMSTEVHTGRIGQPVML